MSKFKFEGLGKQVSDYNDALAAEQARKDKEITQNALTMLNIDTSGTKAAGTGVLVETPEYKKWITEIQKRNRFIGKSYMGSADEYNQESEVVSAPEEVADVNVDNIIEWNADEEQFHVREDYDPNQIEASEADMEGIGKAFVDMCIIRNTVEKSIGWDFDAIMAQVEQEFLAEYGDELVLPDDLADKVKTEIAATEYRHQLAYEHRQENAENESSETTDSQ